MTDIFRKVTPGQALRIPAAAYNAFIDAAIKARQWMPTGGRTSICGLNSQTVLVKNQSGSDLAVMSVVAVTGLAIEPTESTMDTFIQTPVLAVEAPGAANQNDFLILAEPIPAGAIGRAFVSGVIAANIDINDGADNSVEAVEGQTSQLSTTADSPVRLLWKQSGTGSGKLGVIRLGAPDARDCGWFIVNGSPDVIATGQWKYTITKLGSFGVVSGVLDAKSRHDAGLADADVNVIGYNALEVGNTATTIQGLDISGLDETLTVVQVQAGQVVLATRIGTDAGTPVYLFSHPNWVDVECDT